MPEKYFVEIHFTGGELEEIQPNSFIQMQEFIQEILDIRQSDETEIEKVVVFYDTFRKMPETA
jgi:hypothetical protein